ncbi:MAG: hypothetical protein B6D34_07345 [Candidatus Brocadia sp. UTAMX1]|jgi:hypothetical protein|nr:MAG: hypothetical protein B6D34_07345 [Candidatus Brocadia sp. UTAMX1]
MKVKRFNKGLTVLSILFIGVMLSLKTSYSSPSDGKKKAETIVPGVTIVSLDAPLRATIGRRVVIEVVIGNERATKATTILTVTCPTTKQQIGREAKTLDTLSSQKIVYSWNTDGLKEGTYIIRAELEKVPDETVLDDNVRQIEILMQR